MAEEIPSGLEDDKNVIAQCTCKIKNKNYSVILTTTELRWHTEGSKDLKGIQSVRIVDILSVSLKSSSKQESNNDSVCVTYVRQEKKLILKSCCVVFSSDDSQITNNLHQQINDLVKNVGQRPKKLLVVISSLSGRKNGRTVYEQTVAPIFQDAGIETKVFVTEKARHTEEILSTYDIKSINGLVLVGGDGTYHEAVNGIMKRLATEQGLNVDDPDETLPDIDLTIGMIPCGTSNGIADLYYGNRDVATAALSIAIGYNTPAHIMSVHSEHKLLAYAILLVGYGFGGDLMNATESRRNQGVYRYPRYWPLDCTVTKKINVAIAEQIFVKTFRRMQLTIQYVSDEIPAQLNNSECNTLSTDGRNDNTATAEGTSDDTEISDTAGRTSNKSFRSATIKEKVIGSVVLTMRNLLQPSMFLNRSSRKTKYISFLYHMGTRNFNAINAREDMAVLPGKEWTVKLEEPSEPGTENWELEHILDIDGEIFKLSQPEYKVKLLSDKIRLFSNMPYVTKRVIE